ncbi:pyridoxal phosphate-dependent transferase [Pelagophyceae sp. CCMP2097]|nr:pyridoxal phosphate-dependent transferase [Pelagophyceae sp. CCMP2097]
MTALPAADPPAADPRGAVQADVEVEDAQSSNVPLEAGDVPSEAVQSDVPVPSPDLLQRTGTYLRRMTSPGTSAVPAGADPPAADAPSDDLLARTGTYLRRMTRGKSAAPAVDAPAATAQADAQADARAAVPTTLHQPPLLTRTGHYLRRETLRLVWRARGDGAGASAPERNTAVKFVEAVVAEFVAAETKEFRKSDVSNFAWATNGTFLNHGGLGGPSRGVQRLRGFADEVANRQPMAWYRDAAPALMSRAKEVVCGYIGVSDLSRFQFVQNVSVGLFAVLVALDLQPGDVLVTTSVRYHSVDDCTRHLCAKTGAILHVVQVPLPATNHAAVAAIFASSLDAAALRGKVRLAVFDHISSKPAIIFPVKAMVEACHARNVPCLVDGAHAPGSLRESELCVEALGADFYCVNFHKWLNAPRAAAGIYVKGTYRDVIDQSSIDPAVAPKFTASSAEASYVTDALTQGVYDESTRDSSHFIVLPLCVALARRDEGAFQNHRLKLVSATAATLSRKWGTENIVPAELCANMVFRMRGLARQTTSPSLLLHPSTILAKAIHRPSWQRPSIDHLGKGLRLLAHGAAPRPRARPPRRPRRKALAAQGPRQRAALGRVCC